MEGDMSLEAIWEIPPEKEKLNSGYILKTQKQTHNSNSRKALRQGWLWKTVVIFDLIIVLDVLLNYGRITSALFFLLFGWWF